MLTHLDSKDRPVMVNVADKIPTQRTAHAAATVWLPQAVAALFKDGELPTKKELFSKQLFWRELWRLKKQVTSFLFVTLCL